MIDERGMMSFAYIGSLAYHSTFITESAFLRVLCGKSIDQTSSNDPENLSASCQLQSQITPALTHSTAPHWNSLFGEQRNHRSPTRRRHVFRPAPDTTQPPPSPFVCSL